MKKFPSMIIIPLSSKTRAFAIASAVKALKRGEVVAFPTETVYGIGCDAKNVKAVKRLFAIKGRDEKKPIQLIAGSMKQATSIAALNCFEEKIAKVCWPGPLTLLTHLKKGKTLASRVNPKRVIGIRVTSDRFLQECILAFGSPIAATSANQSGKIPASSGKGVVRAFKNVNTSTRVSSHTRPDLLIDAGARPRRKPTTVVRISDAGVIEIVRQGGIRIS